MNAQKTVATKPQCCCGLARRSEPCLWSAGSGGGAKSKPSLMYIDVYMGSSARQYLGRLSIVEGQIHAGGAYLENRIISLTSVDSPAYKAFRLFVRCFSTVFRAERWQKPYLRGFAPLKPSLHKALKVGLFQNHSPARGRKCCLSMPQQGHRGHLAYFQNQFPARGWKQGARD